MVTQALVAPEGGGQRRTEPRLQADSPSPHLGVVAVAAHVGQSRSSEQLASHPLLRHEPFYDSGSLGPALTEFSSGEG